MPMDPRLQEHWENSETLAACACGLIAASVMCAIIAATILITSPRQGVGDVAQRIKANGQ